MLRRRHILFVGTIALIVVVATVAMWGLAAAVTVNLLVPAGNWRPLIWLTAKPAQEDFTVASGSGRELAVRVYRPRSADAADQLTGLVIYSPFTGGGLDDDRLVNLASTMARAGFLVATPWHARSAPVIDPADVEDVVSSVEFLISQGAGQVGLFGISYGNGPVFVAADRLGEVRVPFIVSLNGFYDLQNFVDFIRSDQADPFTGEVLDNTLALYADDLDSFLASAEFENLRLAVSPSVVAERFGGTVYLIHSTDDPFIPSTESVHLRAALRNAQVVLFSLTDVIQHGSYRPLTPKNSLRYYWPAARSFTRLVQHLMTQRP